MSYLVLARKYRPKNFESIVGQDHVVRALKHALESQRLHHAYLFTGTRGIGKTTLSRILAKSLNCEKGITAVPCGECEACKAIDSDRFVDYIEMDAASNRGIADMLQLLEQAVYAPTAARFKIYMIDEVHMLTSQAFNAMLKTLEEPPEYVKFILATTDPQKIPVTVLSRCLQFNLKQMPSAHIVGHLARILEMEGISYEKMALQLLAQGAQGSMRDALSLTDQAIAYTAGNVTGDAVQDMLGSLDRTYLVRMLDCLAVKDGAGLLKIADEMAFRSLSYSAALQDLGALLHKIAIAQNVSGYVAEDLPDSGDILRLAEVFSPEEVQLYYQIAMHGRNELGLAPDEYAGFSMTLLRMLAFVPDKRKLNPVTVQKKMPETVRTVADVTVEVASGGEPPSAGKSVNGSEKSAGSLPPWADDPAPDTVPAMSSSFEKNPSVSSADMDGTRQRDSAVSTLPENGWPRSDWDGNWPALASGLPLRGMAQQLAQQTELVRWEKTETSCHLHLRSPIATLCTPNNVGKLTAVLSDRFGCAVKITTEVGKVEATANQNAIEARAERQRQAEEAMTKDPYIQTLTTEFGGHIVEGSIKPL